MTDASHVLPPGSSTVLVRSPVETMFSGKGRVSLPSTEGGGGGRTTNSSITQINTMDMSPEGEMLVLGKDNGELQIVERTGGSRVRVRRSSGLTG